MPAHLQDPIAGTVCDPLCFRIEGWAHLGARHDSLAAIQFWIDDERIGETNELFARADVCAALTLPAGVRTGFIHFAYAPAAVGREAELRLRARFADGTTEPVLAQRLRFSNRDHRQAPYGEMLDASTTRLFRRENIYGSGPSLLQGSGEVLDLAQRYLGPPPVRVLDVGCGLGFYGRHLLAAGYDWMGAEMKPSDCTELARAGLPHRQVDGTTLPFADGEFDSALCIEVLEHIADPRAFLQEVRRVSPRRVLFSVPNAELLPFLHAHLVVPWHILEADHKSFFTRWSLGALLREFFPHVEVLAHTRHPLPTADGAPVYYNLFAVASA